MVEFSIKNGSPEKQRSACVVVGVFEPRKLSLAADIIDSVAQGYISDIVRRGDMEGKVGTTLLLHNVPNVLTDRILLVGLGKERDFKDRNYREAFRLAIKTLNDTGSIDATVYLTELAVKRRDLAWKIEQAVMMTTESLYRFDRLKTRQEESRRPLRKLILNVNRRRELTIGEAAIERGLAIAQGIGLAKDLGNLPGNICTPNYLADQSSALAKEYNFKVEILDEPEMLKLGMGSFLSVAKGSRQPAKLIIMQYEGAAKSQPPYVLVGKGITFDAGGISIKPAAEMDEMKFDMCGAASVLGTLKAVAQLRLPLNVVGIIPSCENLPDGNANKPGDVVTSMSGQTIEVLNTDAEGRLILADALTYAERFNPELVIDIATLTGACVIALGHHATGLFSNSDTLAKELLQAAEYAHDRAWHMPLWEDYQEQLRSNFADMANIGGRPGGSITAACFLSRFTQNYDWAHLDIAGTAWKSGREKGGTGRPVALLTHFLIGRAADNRSPS